MLVSPPITKFTPPRLPSTLVDRRGLVERLEATGAPVTLVTGFAGAGKTVLLTSWIGAHPERAPAWLSCDSWDRDPARFWTSILTALRQIDTRVGSDALDWMETDGDATIDVVASIVNDLSALDSPTALVIDDLHSVPTSATRGLAEFLERLPPKVRVVIGSRSDPVLPLHRWRVSRRLAELRDADLRLGVDEADAMLHAFGVHLDPRDVERLTTRTEGWAAGMQLAALSLRGRDDAAGFVRMFAGSERNVADFLVGEVLERQDEHVVDFLMATSIVDTFDAGLAEHLSGRADAGVLLRAAEATGLFIVPLDGERHAYRYHQLFRDLLRERLNAADRDRALALHLRAAGWYEARGAVAPAMQHLMRGGDVDRAFEMLHAHVLEAWFAPASVDLGALLDELPEDVVAEKRERILDFAVGLALAGKIEATTFWLQRASHAATVGPPVDAIFEARLEAGYAVLSSLRGEAEEALAGARRALELIPRGIDPAIDAVPLLVLRSQYLSDDFAAARRTYEEAAPGWADMASFVILRGAAALNECGAGNLRVATEYAESALAWATRAGVHDHVGAVDIQLTLAFLELEREEIDEAEQRFERSLRRAETVRLPIAVIALLGLAGVWHARGEWRQATAAVERALEVLPFGARSPLVHRVHALDLEFALVAGDLGRAESIAAALPDTPQGSLARARFHLATQDTENAQTQVELGRARTVTRRQDLELSLIEAKIAVDLASDPTAALDRALGIARREGFVRTVVTADPVVTGLLADRLRRTSSDPYSDALIAAIERTAHPVAPELHSVDALSERERAVLRWLPTRLTAREIADELFISMNTLKTHLKSIYRKLDATSRAEAVAHAGARGLLRL